MEYSFVAEMANDFETNMDKQNSSTMRNIIIIITLLVFSSMPMKATETKIMVRAKAKDAKFIGSSIGGAYVIIRNELTKEILAEGLTEGSTGNTNLIMKEPKERNDQLADNNTAGFLAAIDINEPTFIEVEVFSPNAHKQSQIKASIQLWLIPGKHILGDGVVLEIPGFIIDILEPRTHQFIQIKNLKDGHLSIEANIVMMCGCTISNGGIWDALQMEVMAIINRDGKKLTRIPMKLKEVNLFEANVKLKETGIYEISVYAYNGKTGNTGFDKLNFVLN